MLESNDDGEKREIFLDYPPLRNIDFVFFFSYLETCYEHYPFFSFQFEF